MSIANEDNQSIINEFQKLIKQIEYDMDNAPNRKESIKHSFRLKQVKNIIKILSNYKKKITSGEQVQDIKGIGKDTVKRINEILKIGKLAEITIGEQTDKINKQLDELEQIIGIGRKTAHDLITKYNIKSIKDLKKAHKNGKILLNDNILMGLKYHGVYQQMIPRTEMVKMDYFLHQSARLVDYKLLVIICGSYRRLQMTSNDIDCMIVHPEIVTKKQLDTKKNYLHEFIKILVDKKFIVDSLTSHNPTNKYMGFCQVNKDSPIRRIDIRYVPYNAYYTALLYFTGSGSFNQKMRMLAIESGYKLSEYGLYKKEGDDNKKLKITSEEQIFEILGMEYLTPDKRK